MVKNQLDASVIIPVYNRQESISQSITSILKQKTTFKYEILVINDGSTDDTARIVKSFKNNVISVEKENGGPGSARNLGVIKSQSDIIIFLDSDDRALRGRLEKQIRCLKNSEFGACFGGVIFEGEKKNGDLTNHRFYELKNPFGILVGAVPGPMLWNSTSAIRKDIYIRSGMQREDFKSGEDFEFWCRVSRMTKIAYSKNIHTWIGRSGYDHVSYSNQAYLRKAKTLLVNYKKYAHEFNPMEKSRAYRNLSSSFNALFRHEWAFHGTEKLISRLYEYRNETQFLLDLKWRIMRFIPGVIGRITHTILLYCRENIRSKVKDEKMD